MRGVGGVGGMMWAVSTGCPVLGLACDYRCLGFLTCIAVVQKLFSCFSAKRAELWCILEVRAFLK